MINTPTQVRTELTKTDLTEEEGCDLFLGHAMPPRKGVVPTSINRSLPLLGLNVSLSVCTVVLIGKLLARPPADGLGLEMLPDDLSSITTFSTVRHLVLSVDLRQIV